MSKMKNYMMGIEDEVFGMGVPKGSRGGIDSVSLPNETDLEWSTLL